MLLVGGNVRFSAGEIESNVPELAIRLKRNSSADVNQSGLEK